MRKRERERERKRAKEGAKLSERERGGPRVGSKSGFQEWVPRVGSTLDGSLGQDPFVMFTCTHHTDKDPHAHNTETKMNMHTAQRQRSTWHIHATKMKMA